MTEMLRARSKVPDHVFQVSMQPGKGPGLGSCCPATLTSSRTAGTAERMTPLRSATASRVAELSSGAAAGAQEPAPRHPPHDPAGHRGAGPPGGLQVRCRVPLRAAQVKVRRGKRLKDPEKPCKLGKRSPAGQMTGKSSASSSLLRVHAVRCSLRRRYWEPVFEDSLDLIAKLPTIAATIYRCAACAAQRRGLTWPLCALACAAVRHEGCLGSIPSLPVCLPALLQEHVQGGPSCGGAPSAGLGRQPGAHDG